jgi:hypothetical protein
MSELIDLGRVTKETKANVIDALAYDGLTDRPIDGLEYIGDGKEQ